MARTEVDGLMDSLWTSYKEYAKIAADLSNAQLDTQVPSFGGRETALRNMMYQAVYQLLEQAIHVTKILRTTGAAAAEPSESQHILSEAAGPGRWSWRDCDGGNAWRTTYRRAHAAPG